MIQIYDPTKHEMLALKWYFDVRADPDEFEQVFAAQLNSLTRFLDWCAKDIQIAFDSDAKGIFIAAWLEPTFAGAFAGAWIRKEKRHTKAALAFMNLFYNSALEQYPVLLGVTRQERLHKLHLKLGYQFTGRINYLWDGHPVYLYAMDRDSRALATNRRAPRASNGLGA